MKKHNTKYFMLFTVIVMSVTILFVGCNKTNLKANKSDINQNITVANGMLKFNSFTTFDNTIKNIKANPSVDPKVILNKILGENKYKEFANKLKAGAASPAKDTIVDDQAYSSVLNNKGEVQVGSSRYRITPYGTFLYKPENEDKVNQLTAALQQKKPIEEAEVQPYFYKDGHGIYRYATLKQARSNTVEYSSNNSESSTNQDIKTYVFTDSKTVVGNLITKLTGYTNYHASYTRYFEPHRRIKVKFSSPNFLLFSYINVKVKFQLKNWIGWSKTKCSKMVLGWDGIEYKYKKPLPTPQNTKPYSNSWNNYDNWEYSYCKPISTNTNYFTFIIPYFNKEVNFSSNDVAKMFKLFLIG